MNDALRQLETLLSNAASAPVRFAPNSRYNAVALLTRPGADGRQVAYVARRFIGAAVAGVVPQTYTIVGGDRLDLIANRFIGDPEQWWKIADANPTLDPQALTAVPGRQLEIPSPDMLGVGPGVP